VVGILSGESQVADFQYPNFRSFNCRDRFEFGGDQVRSDDCELKGGYLYPDSSIVRKTACHEAILGFVMGHDLRRLFVSR